MHLTRIVLRFPRVVLGDSFCMCNLCRCVFSRCAQSRQSAGYTAVASNGHAEPRRLTSRYRALRERTFDTDQISLLAWAPSWSMRLVSGSSCINKLSSFTQQWFTSGDACLYSLCHSRLDGSATDQLLLGEKIAHGTLLWLKMAKKVRRTAKSLQASR